MNIAGFTSEASDHASRIDHIFYALVSLSAVISVLVFTLVVGFAYRYRRGSKAPRGKLPKFLQSEFEIGWTAATLFLFLFIFWWVAGAQLSDLLPPAHALEINIVAKQWMWRVEQPSGIQEINEIHVPAGQQVKLSMTSQDVIHSMFLPALRIKQDVLPSRTTYLWFTATKTGVFSLLCAEFCGTEHARMSGRIVVLPAAEYAEWTAAQRPSDGLASQGKVLFRSFGCSGCHEGASAVRAPDLHGVYGREVHLSDGRTVTADDAYLRDSILLPGRDVVAGFKPEMPSFQGVVDERQIIRLLAYLKSLSANKGTSP
jgi:cytochrome c oxidase subunit 2